MRLHFPTVGSTQDALRGLAAAGAGPGTYAVADRQDSGRGRLDHRWVSPLGGLYLSILFAEPPFGRSLVPLALGAAVAGALQEFGARSRLKWPNDLLVESGDGPPRKLAGVLVDRVEEPRRSAVLVAGVGVNVRSALADYPPELASRVVQLSDIAHAMPTVRDVEERVVSALVEAMVSLGTRVGWNSTIRDCRTALYGAGRRAVVDGTLEGVIRGIDDEGALEIETGDGVARVEAGDVVVEGM